MTGERTEKALTRMDLALRRIESASTRAASSLTGQARRNEALRQAVAETLRDLDSLINSHSADGAGGA